MFIENKNIMIAKMPSKTDIDKNKIIKDLGLLLPQLDSRVSWVDYIPRRKLSTNQDIVILGLKNGKVKYIDITGESHFDLVNKILNTMNDWNMENQFLNTRRAALIEPEIYRLSRQTSYWNNKILQALSNKEISNDECEDFVLKAQTYGVFPDFFIPNLSHEINVHTLSDFLKTNKSTFIDTELLSAIFENELENHIEKKSEQEFEEYSYI